jgi:hypothetical protein
LEQLARSDIGEGAVPFTLDERGTEREGRKERRGGEGNKEFQVHPPPNLKVDDCRKKAKQRAFEVVENSSGLLDSCVKNSAENIYKINLEFGKNEKRANLQSKHKRRGLALHAWSRLSSADDALSTSFTNPLLTADSRRRASSLRASSVSVLLRNLRFGSDPDAEEEAPDCSGCMNLHRNARSGAVTRSVARITPTVHHRTALGTR